MVLMRGQNQYPLGITQLTYSNNPARVAKPRVIAHRGYHKDGAAQNSVAALAKAQELGIYGSEFDVWITADGKVVINHDSTVPGSSLVIENVNYDQIKDLTLANGEKLPTLDDYLEQATKNADTKLILEIKRHSSAANNARAADAVIEAVKAKGLTDRVEYIAFDYTTCKRIVNALPGAMVQYLNGDLAPAAVRQDGIGGIDYRFSAYSGNPGWVKEAHANGMVTNVWTVDTVQDMMTCIAMGNGFHHHQQPRDPEGAPHQDIRVGQLTAAGRCACARGFHPAPRSSLKARPTADGGGYHAPPPFLLPCGKQKRQAGSPICKYFLTLCIRYEHGACRTHIRHTRREPRSLRRDVRPLLCAADGLRTPLPERELGAGRRAGRIR